MRKLLLIGLVGGSLWGGGWVKAEAPEKVRVTCDPAKQCPGKCRCVEATLEVTFDGDTQSVLEVEGFTAGARVSAVVVLDTKSESIDGWSFGLDHDDAFLTLESVTVEGTDAEAALVNGFVAVQMTAIETCAGSADPAAAGAVRPCPSPAPSKGCIFGVVLNFGPQVGFPLGRHTVARAEYVLKADPGPAGTEIRIVDYLRKQKSPPADILLVADGQSAVPEVVVDGWVRNIGCPAGRTFLRGDVGTRNPGRARPADGILNISDPILILAWLFLDSTLDLECKKAADANDDGKIQLTDAVFLLQYLFSGGRPPMPPFPEAGVDVTEDPLDCCGGPRRG